MKRATAYKLRDLVIVHSNSQTIDGIWIVGAPFTTIRFDDSVESLGDKLSDFALGRSLDAKVGHVVTPFQFQPETLVPQATVLRKVPCNVFVCRRELFVAPRYKPPSIANQ